MFKYESQMLPLSMAILIAMVIVIAVGLTIALIMELPPKVFIEVAVAIIGIGTSVIAVIEYFYRTKDKQVKFSQDKVADVLAGLDPCILDEMNGGSCGNVSDKDVIAALVQLDGSLASDRYNIYIPLLIRDLWKSETIRTVWERNKIWFSYALNNYAESL